MPWVPKDGELFPSLGWALLDWVADWFDVPKGPLVGRPFVANDDQRSEWVRWYALDPETGLFVYSSMVVIGPQGSGKSPFHGSVGALAQLVGPVVFDGWDAEGQPVGVPMRNPLVQIAATAEEQTDNMYLPALAMAANSPQCRKAGVDAGDTRIRLKGRPGRIEIKTNSGGARQGETPQAVFIDESGMMTSGNGGVSLVQTMRGNAEKTFYPVGEMRSPLSVDSPGVGAQAGRSVAVSNMWQIGEGSVAETDAGDDGVMGDEDCLGVVHRGIPVRDPKDLGSTELVERSLRKAYGAALIVRGDGGEIVSGHIPLEARVKACQSAKYTANWVRRMFLSLPVKGDSAFVDLDREWDPLNEPRDLLPDEPVVLSFDPSFTQDTSQLRGFAVGDEDAGVLPFTFKRDGWSWARPEFGDGDWQVDPVDVEMKIVEALNDLNVVLFVVDPAPWWPTVTRWERKWGEYGDGGIVLRQSTNSESRFGPMVDDYATAMRQGLFRHDGDQIGRDHLANAVEAKKGKHTVVRKESGSKKIDDVITQILGWHGVNLAIDHKLTAPPGSAEFWNVTW